MLRISLPLMLSSSFASSSRLVVCGITLHAVSPSFGSSKTVWYYRCLGLDPHKAMKKSGVEKKVLQKNRNKGTCEDEKTRNDKRFLITVNFLGSSGPVRFVVNMRDLVSGVIESALKNYAREGRLPVLGFDACNFLLYPANAGGDALNPLEPIGSYGARNFVLCKKKVCATKSEPRSKLTSPKNNGAGWKAWLNKSFSFKILSL